MGRGVRCGRAAAHVMARLVRWFDRGRAEGASGLASAPRWGPMPAAKADGRATGGVSECRLALAVEGVGEGPDPAGVRRQGRRLTCRLGPRVDNVPRRRGDARGKDVSHHVR
ncbi:hypothetical protein BSZ37_12665 [Rubrivirga marina]|uniref:Uncharacterized protein n=1 Tax=Rubrivirga marina TaxID=1196024 RepID=A0A271J2E5_9BACT|nr:hypothetical protein BSZ37_12665 [Rubrivirga marina]